MIADAYEPEVVVIRKPQPAREPDFRCVCCDQWKSPNLWWGRAHNERVPICLYCETRWGTPLGTKIRASVTRGDRRGFLRLSAMVARLEWEVRNGAERWRGRHV